MGLIYCDLVKFCIFSGRSIRIFLKSYTLLNESFIHCSSNILDGFPITFIFYFFIFPCTSNGEGLQNQSFTIRYEIGPDLSRCSKMLIIGTKKVSSIPMFLRVFIMKECCCC